MPKLMYIDAKEVKFTLDLNFHRDMAPYGLTFVFVFLFLYLVFCVFGV